MPKNGAGLVYIERSKTDQAGEGAYVVITPDTSGGPEASASRTPRPGATMMAWYSGYRCLR